MGITLALLALGIALLVWFICEKIKAYTVKAAIIKSLVSLLFIAVAVWGWYSSGLDVFGVFVVMGLVFGLLGDIWLDLKYVFPQEDGIFTYAGFAVFAVGHVLYTAGMLLRYYLPGNPLYIMLPLCLAVLLSTGNLMLEKPMKLNFGKLRGVVVLYGILLFSTMFISGALSLLHGWREMPLNLIFAGSILFALSDLILSGTFFGSGRDKPVDIALNYLSYYPAQFLIALSLMFVK